MSRSVSAVAVASGVLNVACCGASSVAVGTSCGVSSVIGFGMIAKAVTFTAFSFSDFCTLFFCTFLFVFIMISFLEV